MKIFDIFDHEQFKSFLDTWEDPDPGYSAKHAWHLLAKNILEVWKQPNETPPDVINELHETLCGIPGNCTKPRDTECDACDFLNALALQGRFCNLPYLFGSGIHDFSQYDELIDVISKPIPEDWHISHLSPQEHEEAVRCLRRAAERIKWLRSVKDGSDIVSEDSSNKEIIPRVTFMFNKRDELVKFCIDGKEQSLSGTFSDAKMLLLALNKAPDRKLSKKNFEHDHPNALYRGKYQLKSKIGSDLFELIYHDAGRSAGFITLSNLIEITKLHD